MKEKEDRQKEREPAWMDTYIPDESTSGILGGQAPNGELDGIQAWKKGLKEKDTTDQEVSTTVVVPPKTSAQPISSTSDNALDEIQIFRLLMKKEEDKKRLEENATAPANEPAASLSRNNDHGTPNASTGILFTLLPYFDSKLMWLLSNRRPQPQPALCSKQTILLFTFLICICSCVTYSTF
jgi:hypothetical protein